MATLDEEDYYYSIINGKRYYFQRWDDGKIAKGSVPKEFVHLVKEDTTSLQRITGEKDVQRLKQIRDKLQATREKIKKLEEQCKIWEDEINELSQKTANVKVKQKQTFAEYYQEKLKRYGAEGRENHGAEGGTKYGAERPSGNEVPKGGTKPPPQTKKAAPKRAQPKKSYNTGYTPPPNYEYFYRPPPTPPQNDGDAGAPLPPSWDQIQRDRILLHQQGITDRKSWKRWLMNHHPDKITVTADISDLVGRVNNAVKNMNW